MTERIDELTVLCALHQRRCMLVEESSGPAKIRHMSRVGTPVEYCSSQIFTVRHESKTDRETAYTEMLNDQIREQAAS